MRAMAPRTIKRTRRAFNFSQSDLARYLAVVTRTVSRWETGVSVPSTLNMRYLWALHGRLKVRTQSGKS